MGSDASTGVHGSIRISVPHRDRPGARLRDDRAPSRQRRRDATPRRGLAAAIRRTMRYSLVLLACLVACGGGDDVAVELDAAVSLDAAVDADQTCPQTVSDPLRPGSIKLFIDTEGVTLTRGNCDDSRTNCT